MSSVNRVVVAMLAVTALAVAFWMLALGPKRTEDEKLGTTISSLKESLATDQAQVDEALAARRSYATDYGQLVVLGKAVPTNDETASLLVQINHIAEKAHVRFEEISLSSEGSTEAAAVPEAGAAPTETPSAGGATTVAAPTEASASLLPLGASIGPAGLDVMPYTLKFTGDFVHVADFIHGLDVLVKTANSRVAVDGRLITIDGFSLGVEKNSTFPHLEANFAITTYLTPESQGITAGATAAAPGAATATPAAAITGAAP